MRLPIASTAASTLAGLLLCTSSATAQGNAWIVDDDPGGDFLTIQEAVDAADDGDLILVRGGAYGPFEIDGKSLFMVGQEQTVVTAIAFIFGGGVAAPPMSIHDLASDQTVVVRNMRFETLQISGKGIDELLPGARLDDNLGAIHLEDCDFVPQSGLGLRAEDCSSVSISRCTIDAGTGFYYSFNNEYWSSAGLLSTNSDVAVYDSTVRGTLGPAANSVLFSETPAGVGGRGAQLSGGSVVFQGSTVNGGDGGDGHPQVCGAEEGGVGIRLTLGTPVRLLDSVVEGGAGGVEAVECGGGVAPDGAVFEGDLESVEDLDGLARSFEWPAVVPGGGLLPANFDGEPGDYAFLLATLDVVPGDYLDHLGVTLFLPQPLAILPIGVLPTGDFTLPLGMPSLIGIQDFGRLCGQAAYFDDRGDAYLSAPSVAVILNENLL